MRLLISYYSEQRDKFHLNSFFALLWTRTRHIPCSYAWGELYTEWAIYLRNGDPFK